MCNKPMIFIQSFQYLLSGEDLHGNLWKTVNIIRTGVVKTRLNIPKPGPNNKENGRQTDELIRILPNIMHR